jgi:GAF domain-containing protein
MSDVPARKATGPLSDQLTLVQSLYRVAQEIGGTLDLNEILDRAVKGIAETLKVDHATILLYDARTNIGEVVAEYPDKGSKGVQVSGRASTTIELMMQSKRSLLIPDVSAAGDILQDNQPAMISMNIKSLLLTPIIFQEQFIGSIGIDAYGTMRDFTPLEIDSLETIAIQLANAIQNARVYQATVRRAAQVERLASFGRRLASTLERDAIFQVLSAEINDLLACDGVSVALHQTGEPSIFLYLLDEKQARPVVIEYPFGETALRFVCNSNETLLLDDISRSEYPDYQALTHHAAPDSWDSRAVLRSAVIVPLIVGGRNIGTVNLTRTEASAFKAGELVQLVQIVNPLAVALENARLFAQTADRGRLEQLLSQSALSAVETEVQALFVRTMEDVGQALRARIGRVRLQMPTVDGEELMKMRQLTDSNAFQSEYRPNRPRFSTDRSVRPNRASSKPTLDRRLGEDK